MFNFLEDVNITKEIDKKKKKRYGEELRLQIEQDKKRKLEEKIKSRQESLRNLKLFQTSQINNYNTLNNENEFLENYNKNYHYLKNSMDNPLINYKLKENFISFSNKKNSYNNIYNNLNNNIKKNLEDSYKRAELDFAEKNNNFFNSYFNSNSKKNNFVENGIYIMKKSPSLILNNNYHSESLNNYNNENNITNTNTNIINNTLMAEINLQFLFRQFVEQQIKTINNYENNIENIFYFDYKNNNDNLIKSLLEQERNKAFESIKNEQNKLKDTLGYFPMEKNYNLKIEQLFNKILNKKIKTYASIKDFDNLVLNKLKNKENNNAELWKYKSKYEDETIENSFPNFQNLSQSSQKTLRGYSKLVKINNNKGNEEDGEKNNNFLESWREQLEKEISEGNNKNINISNNKSIILNNDINIDNNLNKIGNENGNNLKDNVETFPINQIFKNAKNIDIKNNKNKLHININDNNLDLNKNNYSNEINFGKRFKSAKEIFNANTISSNNKQILKETPENENETHSNKYNNIIKNDIQRNMIYKKNINNNNINKNGKNNINLKKVDPSFMRNAKKGISLKYTNDNSKNYDNFLVLKRDDNRTEENNKKNKEEFANSQNNEKFKSSGSSESEKT